MAVKRKFDIDSDEVPQTSAKQLKLIPFPNVDSDDDVHMFDAEPLYLEPHHSRLPSNVSSTSSNGSESPSTNSPAYPSFDLYPMPFFSSEGSVNTNSHNYAHYATHSPKTPPIGLLQPTSAFVHHGTNCSQIPKLRIACAAGLNGQRTMWSFCEQCGAISMVEND
ncbi:hypothetical protein Hypma_008053 [Hypsizygus marmoreus]|uniref:Uncharacterized protein n=1 Tax=Hypsizygus marmoreus TaxID=39966 RepID=A0A369K341_HYPMA|nr:hypothetical protein Hypma_008053 [Hypsizygus marmoreus]